MIDDIVPPRGGGGGSRPDPAQNKPIFINRPQKQAAEDEAVEKPLDDWGDTPNSDEAVAIETETVDATDQTDETPAAQEPDDQPPKQKRGFKWPLDRTWTIILVVAVVVLIPAGALAYHATHNGPKSAVITSKKQAKAVPKVTTVPSTLTGLQVDKSVNDRPVVAAMVENSPDARPQSGLDEAGIVYEALAEGGVTRFMTVFQDTQPTYVGPIRSARPYYVQWALGYDAAYAHVGGSPDALADIKSWNVRDINQFYNAGAFNRVSSRAAPHNVYTSIAGLAQLAQQKGYNSSKYTGFERKSDAKSKTPNATSIDMTFSGPLYNPHFDYDAATNSYKRSQAGAPHMTVDAAGAQKQISPKVVLGLVVPKGQGALDSSGAYYSDYKPIGSGQVFVFQDGTLTTGTWTKTANEAPLTIADAAGKPIKLDAGQTWISAVPTAENVTYK